MTESIVDVATGDVTTGAGATTATPDAQRVEDLPLWAQERISKLSGEAAQTRVKAKDRVEAAKSEVEQTFQGQVAEANARALLSDQKYLKLAAVLNLDVPAKQAVKFAERVSGDTAEEITASATGLVELFGAVQPTNESAVDPTQGKQTPMALNGDPLEQALRGALGME
jgi:hypothetical protein